MDASQVRRVMCLYGVHLAARRPQRPPTAPQVPSSDPAIALKAWPNLPDAIEAAIVGMVSAATVDEQ
jgi:hypothetical protein